MLTIDHGGDQGHEILFVGQAKPDLAIISHS